jgi:hypothetical protein
MTGTCLARPISVAATMIVPGIQSPVTSTMIPKTSATRRSDADQDRRARRYRRREKQESSSAVKASKRSAKKAAPA